jgi:hypothetical protein
MAVQCLEK